MRSGAFNSVGLSLDRAAPFEVGDFGLACQLKQLGAVRGGRPGLVGTPGYAAPEASGGAAVLTDKADVYAGPSGRLRLPAAKFCGCASAWGVFKLLRTLSTLFGVFADVLGSF